MTQDEQRLACEIGLILQRLRRDKGWTQKTLAQRVAGGVNTTYIGKIERGDQLPSLKILLRLSQALEVSVGDFFYSPMAPPEDATSPVLHLEPLLQALRNRGIDGVALVRAVLDAVGQHVLVGAPAASRSRCRCPGRTRRWPRHPAADVSASF
ncbi:helix-turn-helix domain-containing protein [Candidatus Entotheonella palauensis]|uniref:helix-turn-helix domain-containing protein n=1 Tax=Candidatus Entotheonella palauensis TaxID=93172 RepID=UPI000B7F39CC|nr:helix-turn-helix transcriptional regulator [Candidatus Entotheonella palauensis]